MVEWGWLSMSASGWLSAREALLLVMRALVMSVEVQSVGCHIISIMCAPMDATDVGGMHRRQLALNAGALSVVVNAMALRTSQQLTEDADLELRTYACMALTVLVAQDESVYAEALALGADRECLNVVRP